MHASAFSDCGSLFAASSGDGRVNVTICDMKKLIVLQTIPLDDFPPGPIRNFVFSSDGKKLVCDGGRSDEIMFFQAHDLRIRMRLGEDTDAARRTAAIALDPSSQFMASAGLDSNFVRLRTL